MTIKLSVVRCTKRRPGFRVLRLSNTPKTGTASIFITLIESMESTDGIRNAFPGCTSFKGKWESKSKSAALFFLEFLNILYPNIIQNKPMPKKSQPV